jgi:hypothetical protein
MRSAPAVQFPLGRSSWGRALSCLPAALGWLTGLAWVGLAPALSVQVGAVLLLATLVGVAAWRWGGWNRQGMLVWNGHDWAWQAKNISMPLARPLVRLDGQQFLLLEIHAFSGECLWLWPEQRMAPERWQSLRQAIFLPGALESTAEEPV